MKVIKLKRNVQRTFGEDILDDDIVPANDEGLADVAAGLFARSIVDLGKELLHVDLDGRLAPVALALRLAGGTRALDIKLVLWS